MNTNELIDFTNDNNLNSTFTRLYGSDSECTRQRYINCINQFKINFGERHSVELFSAPGRTEVGGNHTDHQNGRVLAGAVSLDIIACVSKNDNNTIRVLSEGYDVCEVCLDNLSVIENEKNTASALIRGIASRIMDLGYNVSGFDAYTTSNVLCGSGLSSSAAFEVLVASIVNEHFCNGELSPVDLAKISQYAENIYFGKPCGLMDQTACAVGGFVEIDFENPKSPIVENIQFDLETNGYKLVIVNTGANHADLTDDYSSVPADMKSVAKCFGKEFLREVDEDVFFESVCSLRHKVSDRAILRAIHFFGDNSRVLKQASALKENDINSFFAEVNASGNSSYDYLQNVYSSHNPLEQGISLALALTKRFLNNNGACRVHGGGFAGTIQAYIPINQVNDYISTMEVVFGHNCCYELNIRNAGAIKII